MYTFEGLCIVLFVFLQIRRSIRSCGGICSFGRLRNFVGL